MAFLKASFGDHRFQAILPTVVNVRYWDENVRSMERLGAGLPFIAVDCFLNDVVFALAVNEAPSGKDAVKKPAPAIDELP